MERDQQAVHSRVPEFAGLLAALAAQGPRQRPVGDTEVEDTEFDRLFDGLEDDVATLSYARALELRSRNNAPGEAPPGDAAAAISANHHPGGTGTAVPPSASGPLFSSPTGEGPDAGVGLKRASVTLRMSQAECARLRQLAAEAGLTVSAYLRFCAFEVESLRGQVKAALADMRPPQPAAPARRSRWLQLFRPSG